MKDLYFDLIGGISGDMTVAALLDFGVNLEFLKKELKKIKVNGYALKTTKVSRGHVQARKFDVIVRQPKNYSYRQIQRLIRMSSLSADVQKNILNIYRVLADAELKVHGHRYGGLRFEQLGDLDSLVDIASVCICLKRLGVGGLYHSVIPLNKNIAPATSELLLGKRVYYTQAIFENVTPTGMAILFALARPLENDRQHIFAYGRAGYGAGAVDSPEASNVLRLVEIKQEWPGAETDFVEVLEANIDDMNPQFFDYLFEKLFAAGALDVFVQPVLMKKTRPGFLLTVLSNGPNLGMITDLVLQETSTLGIRFYPAQRLKLSRSIKTIVWKGHKVRVKIARLPQGGVRMVPEYEDCKALAKKINRPLVDIYQTIQQRAG
ncbi:MAG: nickel pincer cofactor biosynthesis protein LarC [Candidatus Omnitrophota bacterium]